MSDNQKFLTGLVLGAAAGVAIALFLTQTEKGKALVEDIKKETDDLKDGFETKLSELEKRMTDLIAKGKSIIDEIDQKAKTAEV